MPPCSVGLSPAAAFRNFRQDSQGARTKTAKMLEVMVLSIQNNNIPPNTRSRTVLTAGLAAVLLVLLYFLLPRFYTAPTAPPNRPTPPPMAPVTMSESAQKQMYYEKALGEKELARQCQSKYPSADIEKASEAESQSLYEARGKLYSDLQETLYTRIEEKYKISTAQMYYINANGKQSNWPVPTGMLITRGRSGKRH